MPTIPVLQIFINLYMQKFISKTAQSPEIKSNSFTLLT